MNNLLSILIIFLLITNLVISVAALFKGYKNEENYARPAVVKTPPPTPEPSSNDPVEQEILQNNAMIYQSALEISSLQSDTPYKDSIYGVRKGEMLQ